MFDPNKINNEPKQNSNIDISNCGTATAVIHAAIITPGDIIAIMKAIPADSNIREIKVVGLTDESSTIQVEYDKITILPLDQKPDGPVNRSLVNGIQPPFGSIGDCFNPGEIIPNTNPVMTSDRQVTYNEGTD